MPDCWLGCCPLPDGREPKGTPTLHAQPAPATRAPSQRGAPAEDLPHGIENPKSHQQRTGQQGKTNASEGQGCPTLMVRASTPAHPAPLPGWQPQQSRRLSSRVRHAEPSSAAPQPRRSRQLLSPAARGAKQSQQRHLGTARLCARLASRPAHAGVHSIGIPGQASGCRTPEADTTEVSR